MAAGRLVKSDEPAAVNNPVLMSRRRENKLFIWKV
jgi:hypothetical protein